MKNQYSIYKQYLFLFCITPTIIVIIGIFFGLVNYKFLQDNQRVLYQGEAEKITSIIEEDLNYLTRYSQVIGESIYNEDSPTASSIGKLLQETYSIAEIGQDVTTLTKFDFVLPSGMVIADVTQGKLKIPLMVKKEERSWMESAPKHPWKLQISPIVAQGIVGKDQVIDYGIPVGFGITNKNGKFLGIISAGIDVNKLTYKIKQNLILPYIKFMILSDDNHLIAGNTYTESVNAEILIKNINLKSGNISYQHKNSKFFFYKKMKNYPFIILVGEDLYTLNSNFQKQVIFPITYAVILSILLIILFWFFRNKLIIPVQQLSEIADRISTGDLEIRIPEFKYSEISNLANKLQNIKNYAFELTNTKSLLARKKIELENLNNSLEQKVNARTIELSTALTIKDEFLNNISHEIRTPIQGVASISEGLIENWQKFDDQQKYNYISIVAQNAKRLFSLVANLLDLSKYNQGDLVLDLRQVDLNEVVNDVIDECKALYLLNKKVVFNFDTSKQVMVIIDKERISQVLRNLITNAIKFGLEDNIINIKINKSSEIKVTISDSGMGIPESEIDSIFSPFTQSSRTKTKAGGTGLGLAICKSIIEAHNGRIWAENNHNRAGATFSFILPINQPHHIASQSKNVIKNVMIIDDEESALLTMELILKSSNYNVIEAQGGVEGLAKIMENYHKIDLILLDLMMPDIHGNDLLTKIKENKLTKHIPVIIQSGLANEKEKQKSIKLGAVSFLNKPYSKKDLLERIQNINNSKI